MELALAEQCEYTFMQTDQQGLSNVIQTVH